jgi:hypothetical protein
MNVRVGCGYRWGSVLGGNVPGYGGVRWWGTCRVHLGG